MDLNHIDKVLLQQHLEQVSWYYCLVKLTDKIDHHLKLQHSLFFLLNLIIESYVLSY